MTRARKSCLLVVVAPVAIAAFVALIVHPWLYRSPQVEPVLGWLAFAATCLWIAVLAWALHQLAFQIAAVFAARPAGAVLRTPQRWPSFDVLYATCDDFAEAGPRSCLEQDYSAPGRGTYRVIVCDDSGEHGDWRQRVDAFHAANPALQVARREQRVGHKAGNLNTALRSFPAGAGEWVVVVDADQVLPRDFLTRLACYVAALDDDVAFVQGRLLPARNDGRTPFQQALDHEVSLFFERDLPLRERCGFLPFLGHGGCVRRSVLDELGGFPEVVSEDYALAMVISASRRRGVRAPEASSTEQYPPDHAAFAVRLVKYAEGAAELLRSRVPRFLSSRASLVEKWDLLALLGSYVALPLTLPAVFLSAWVCHRIHELGLPMFHAGIVPSFAALSLAAFAVVTSAVERWTHALRYWSWATAIYAAATPSIAAAFVRGLVGRARFRRTPKSASPRRANTWRRDSIAVLSGIGALTLSVQWLSPFSPVLASHGAAWSMRPLFDHLHAPGAWGRLARVAIHVPLLSALAGLATMWSFATL
jgi:cellulose synthase/poly-beta-1,6-N-acetylglucosamine synthase-like glycosyltransferase